MNDVPDIQVDYKLLDERLLSHNDALSAVSVETSISLGYATAGAAAMDLRACIPLPVIIQPSHAVLVGSGLALDIRDRRYAAMLLPRSGLGHKKGLVLGNLVGLIDSDYQGEVQMSLLNRSGSPIFISPMDRVAQLVFVRVYRAQLNRVNEFVSQSARNEGGFGSTGEG